MKSIFEAVAVPLIGLDSDFQVVVANQAAFTVFKTLAEGVAIDTAISTKTGLRKLLQKTLETGKPAKTTITITEGFGQEFQTAIRLVDTSTNAHSIVLLLTFEDRTPLQDVKAMRSDFVANVSHEIRSPLTAISGFVETLQGPARNDPEARELFLDMMQKEVTRMTNLVRDLLSLSRVEIKERRAPKKTVNPNLIIQQAQESVMPFARKHGKTLVIESDEGLPDIQGNHDDLVRVFINLLENAVTYSTDNGVVRLTAGLAAKVNPLGKNAIHIAVHNEGDGIPASEIPRLTERFYRVDKSRSRNVGGTGLGLAIVKHILVRHRGKLVIKSTLGEGAEFRIFLPLPARRK